MLIPNVTTGINIVINSVCQDYSTENTVLFFNTTYGELHNNIINEQHVVLLLLLLLLLLCLGAVKKVINKVSSERGFSAHELILQFPLKSNSQVRLVCVCLPLSPTTLCQSFLTTM